MATELVKPAALLGQRVAFTGRLSTLTRAEAEGLVAGAGGRVAASVSPRTTMLVVGMRGWPLMESGQVTRNMAEAERLRASGGTIRIVSEVQFREALGLEPPPEAGGKSLGPDQVCSTLGIDRRTLERWEHCGLVRSHEGRYDFRDLVSLRTVTGLVARGVSPVVIRESLDALGAFVPGVERPLAQLNILLSDSGELAAELGEALLTPSGQLEMRFDAVDRGAGAPARLDPVPRDTLDTRDSAAWIEAGLEHEEAGQPEKAEQAYRRAAALSPDDAVPRFNLGNVLLTRRQLKEAGACFAEAVARDPSHAQAWFNLAHVQDALKDPRTAAASLRRAVAADPAYADAHFNLAELAERLGDAATAAAAWREYLRLDPMSPWAGEARRRLRLLKNGAGVKGPAWA